VTTSETKFSGKNIQLKTLDVGVH